MATTTPSAEPSNAPRGSGEAPDPVVGPMPRDVAMVLDPGLRPHARHETARETGGRFPFPIPNGWFCVAYSHELAPGDTKPVFFFGRELVVFRTRPADGAAVGEACVVDSYCAHLGTNLAVGGKVDGDGIRCPFHGWCYDGASGACTDIPYTASERIPTKARIRAFPTLERNGMIWAWHHLEGKEPFYDVPEVPEFEDPEWSDPVSRDFVVATCCQEMAENNHDFAHFLYVHGTPDIPWETDAIITDRPYKKTVAPTGRFTRETFGLGLGVLRRTDTFAFISSTTPIDTEHVLVRWVFVVPTVFGDGAADQLADTFLGAVSQDIPIWENKRYVERPVLTKDEVRILEHRAWSQQFYSDPANAID
jgi:phenylpropionate dioxygenase-like ring-hydroxylating dioxygenase large terminal subunit